MRNTQAGFRWLERFPAVGEDDDRKAPAAGLCGYLLANRGAVDVREQYVEDDGIESAAFEDGQCLDAVSCFTGVIPVQCQRDSEEPAEVVVDLDEKDGASGLRHRPGYSSRRFC